MLSYVLYATLSGHGLPAVKFEPFTETPPNVEFTVTQIPNGYHIKSSEGTNIYQSWKPIIEESWRKSIYGDYWVRSVRKSEAYDELDRLTFGELIWYKNRVWNFIPGDGDLLRQVKGVSRLGQLVEQRYWNDSEHISRGVILHEKPNGAEANIRVVQGATAYPVTDLGDVIAWKYDDLAKEGVTLDITEDVVEICRKDDYCGSIGGTHFFQLPTREDDQEYIPPFYKLDSNSSSTVQRKTLISLNSWNLTPTPTNNVYFSYHRGCFSSSTLGQYILWINGVSFDLMDIAQQIGLEPDYEFQKFDRGRLVITDSNPKMDVEAKQIIGYLSIEGVTPGFHPKR